MDCVHLGNSGLKVSKLCFGTMTFSFQVDEPTLIDILDAGNEYGVNFLDVADVASGIFLTHYQRGGF